MKGQDLIDKLTRQMDAAAASAVAATNGGHPRGRSSTSSPPGPGAVADDVIIEKCRARRDAPKFEALFDRGDLTAPDRGDGSASAADYALLGILKFYTQDPDQLERLMRSSALPRAKWDEKRGPRSLLRFSIENALKDVGETYDWLKDGGRRRPIRSSSSPQPPVYDGDDDDSEVVFFHTLGEPKEREFLVESIGVKRYPIVAFGAGGVAKSFAMLAGGIAIASDKVDRWLGLRVLEHGYVLYLDFELDQDEQHRRVRDLCAGMGIEVPARLAYLSAVGMPPAQAFDKAREFVEEYAAPAVIIDSMGLAMGGQDMEKGREVLAFHGQYINPLRRAGATPFIVDHEGKKQVGEKHKDKTPFGSAYKAWASRSVLQFQLEEYRKETAELDVRVRQTKTNFGPKIEPLGVRFTFEEKKVSIGTYDLPAEELLEEETLPVKERIVAALSIEPATRKQLEDITGATAGTIGNKLSELQREEKVESDGRKPAVYSLRSSSSSQPPVNRGDDDDSRTASTTVAELFATPPLWLANQVAEYRKDPDNRIRALCAAVADTFLGDPLRGGEVREEVERELSLSEGG